MSTGVSKGSGGGCVIDTSEGVDNHAAAIQASAGASRSWHGRIVLRPHMCCQHHGIAITTTTTTIATATAAMMTVAVTTYNGIGIGMMVHVTVCFMHVHHMCRALFRVFALVAEHQSVDSVRLSALASLYKQVLHNVHDELTHRRSNQAKLSQLLVDHRLPMGGRVLNPSQHPDAVRLNLLVLEARHEVLVAKEPDVIRVHRMPARVFAGTGDGGVDLGCVVMEGDVEELAEGVVECLLGHGLVRGDVASAHLAAAPHQDRSRVSPEEGGPEGGRRRQSQQRR